MDTIILNQDIVKELDEWEEKYQNTLKEHARHFETIEELSTFLLKDRPEPFVEEGIYHLKRSRERNHFSYIDYAFTFKLIEPYKYKLAIEFSSSESDVKIFAGEAIVEDLGYTREKVTDVKPHKSFKKKTKNTVLQAVKDIRIGAAIFLSIQYFLRDKLKDRTVVKKYIDTSYSLKEQHKNKKEMSSIAEKQSIRVIDLHQMIQTINLNETHRTFERHVASWGVIGHYRHYRDKDGNITKTIFVKPYTKGKGEKADKIYKII